MILMLFVRLKAVVLLVLMNMVGEGSVFMNVRLFWYPMKAVGCVRETPAGGLTCPLATLLAGPVMLYVVPVFLI